MKIWKLILRIEVLHPQDTYIRHLIEDSSNFYLRRFEALSEPEADRRLREVSESLEELNKRITALTEEIKLATQKKETLRRKLAKQQKNSQRKSKWAIAAAKIWNSWAWILGSLDRDQRCFLCFQTRERGWSTREGTLHWAPENLRWARRPYSRGEIAWGAITGNQGRRRTTWAHWEGFNRAIQFDQTGRKTS